MATFLEMFACLLVLAVVATMAGRALVAAFGVRLLMRRTPETFAVSALLGTALFLLVFGGCSHAGLTARPAAGVVLGVVGILFAATFWRGRAGLLWPRLSLLEGRGTEPLMATAGSPSGVAHSNDTRARRMFRAVLHPSNRQPVASWLLLVGPMIVAVVVSLAPTLYGGGYSAHSDIPGYMSRVGWLQEHSFSESVPEDTDRPTWSYVLMHQRLSLRMGAEFLLAFVVAVVPGRGVVDVYLWVSAWAVALNVAAIFVLCRWSLRLTRPYAALAALLAVATFNPMSFSAVNGFFSQLFGTAYLSVLAALISRSCAPVHWRAGTAFVMGVCGATLLSAYSEMVPLLAAMLGLLLVVQGRYAVRQGQLVHFASCVVVAVATMAVLGNLEFVRAYASIRLQLTSLSGWHVPLKWHEFWGFAMGSQIYEPTFNAHSTSHTMLTIAATMALAAGLLRLSRFRQALPLVTLVAVYVALAVYFSCWKADPWTGERGHTWSVLKICKWAFPVVVALQTAGLAWMAARLPRRGRALAVGAFSAVLIGCGFGTHLEIVRHASDSMQRLAKSPAPLVELRKLVQQIDDLDPPRVYLVATPTVGYIDWNRELLALLLAPRPFVNSWQGAPRFEIIKWLNQPRPFPDDPETLVLAYDGLPGQPDIERLACGLAVVPRDRPVILNVRNPQFVEDHGNGWFAWTGNEPVEVELWSPSPGRVEFSCLADAGPSLPETPRRRMEVRLPGRQPTESTFEKSSRLRFDFDVPAGTSTVKLACRDQRTVATLWNGDSRACLVGLQEFRVASVGAMEQARSTDSPAVR